MAVVVQCFHCDTILELDEGFRGGVCRCSTCGSLLQVPKSATTGAPKARPAAPGAQPAENRRPANPNADPGLSRGQFETPSQSGNSGSRPAAPDFGGSSSGLRQGRPAAPGATATAAGPRRIEKVAPISGPTRPGSHVKQVKTNNALLYVGIALIAMIVIVVVVVVVVFVLNPDSEGKRPGGHDREALPGASQPPGGMKGNSKGVALEGGSGEAAAERGVKGFLGVELAGKKIVLSVDGASSMSDSFDYVRQGIYHAVEVLGPGQEVRVAVWKGNVVKTVPAAGFVGQSGLKELRAQLEVIPAMGSSDAADCMKASAQLGGDQVIFVTAKEGLEPQIADAILEAKTGTVRFDGIKIEGESAPSPLELLATKTGGTYRVVSGTRLEQLAR